MSHQFQIKTCPTCGSKRIQRVVRDVTRQYEGHTYVVPAVEFYTCPVCDERVYDHAAMAKIEAYSPAYRKTKAVARA